MRLKKLSKPTFVLAMWVLANLIIGLIIVPDYGVSMDEDVQAAKSMLALDIYLGKLQEDPYVAFNSFDNETDKYYGTADNVLIRFAERFLFPGSDHQLMVIAHFMYFMTFQLAVVGIYYLSQQFFSQWISLFVALIFGTQPLLYGHGFINPKDLRVGSNLVL